MVRKRTRRYDSDDNDSDSDVELDLEEPAKSEPKRYSLRERKRTLFTSDFDYYGLDEEEAVEVKKQSSDDEDFEVEPEPADHNGGVTTYFEPDPDAVPENSEGLIDFEDIIRADIVVNRNKIDYDNLIQKTEIKLTQASTETSPPNPQKKRRGRPPKNRSDSIKIEVETKIECQPDLGTSISMQNIENEMTEVKEENDMKQEAQESLPNGEVNDAAENKIEDPIDQKQEPLDENSKVQHDPPEETNDSAKVTEEDDDDVILLEGNQPVIVLDD